MAVREQVDKALEGAKGDGLENPLDSGLVIGDGDGLLAAFLPDLADLFGVSRVRLEPSTEGHGVSVQDLRQEPRCERSWRRDGTVAQRADGGWLSDRDAEAVAAAQG
jgi:isoleucyl-tRNA synthetase